MFLRLERFLKRSQLFGQLPQERDDSNAQRSGIDIIRRLMQVHIINGMDDAVIPLRSTQQFNGTIGNNLIHIHIAAGPRSPLIGIDDEMSVQPAVQDLFAGCENGLHLLLRQSMISPVHLGRCLFDPGDRMHQLRVRRPSSGCEILLRPRGMNAIIGILWNGQAAQCIILRPVC
ncbi:hypothetical protein D3C75_929750 [compost metagenome]